MESNKNTQYLLRAVQRRSNRYTAAASRGARQEYSDWVWLRKAPPPTNMSHAAVPPRPGTNLSCASHLLLCFMLPASTRAPLHC
ncbi:hypothetical protein E2C01_025717 [Portunus trituberculatus]|uniref:Uncharacterized protein n=1 Tax=Portunus trituberculatus TaxID=210409 RepID=A0A5B7EGG9_PORTR|nr:hypothetical protein [Portunus trituberculatus]